MAKQEARDEPGDLCDDCGREVESVFTCDCGLTLCSSCEDDHDCEADHDAD